MSPNWNGILVVVARGATPVPATEPRTFGQTRSLVRDGGLAIAATTYRSETPFATDAADVVITVENVERVAETIQIGRRMVGVAKEGIFLGIGASFLLMILASFGYIPPAIGALLQEALDLATILNALRAR